MNETQLSKVNNTKWFHLLSLNKNSNKTDSCYEISGKFKHWVANHCFGILSIIAS